MSQKVIKSFFSQLREFCLNLFFPQLCLNCQRERSWLCDDCQAILEIQSSTFCPICLKKVSDFKTCPSCKRKTNLSGLFWALSYQDPLVKKVIQRFKYEPFIRELSQSLAYLIISHLLLIGLNENWLREFVLIPLPLHKKRKKWRGFDQAEEIAKEISKYFNPVKDSGDRENPQKENISNGIKIPVLNNVLIREKETLPQVDLGKENRKENVKNAFSCLKPDLIKSKKIFLVDDVYTTGATMEEAARVLKEAGAKEVWGMVVAKE
jgi:predicted amidophosphoribosyltransferase